jgi:hypothetical protein
VNAPTGLLDDALDGEALTRQRALAVWEDLTGWAPADRPDAWDAFEDAVRGSLDPAAGLQVRPGGWTVDLAGTIARTSVAAALIAGAMWPAGLDQLPAYVLPQVLPLLFDVRRSRLTRSERGLLLELRLTGTPGQAAYPWPAAALYGRLPPRARDHVAAADFADFLDRLVAAGEADAADADEYVLRPADRPAWFRLTVR